MRTKMAYILTGIALAALLLVSADVVGGYRLDWASLDAGGGTSAAPGYTLSGAIGQPDPFTATGGGYRLAGGFWAAPTVRGGHIYLPMITR